MENFKGKWCINITEENVQYLKKHFKCGAGYYIGQTLFFNEDGSLGGGNPEKSWNTNHNNINNGIEYREISFDEFILMTEIKSEIQYEIY